ncbi:hypothetical protein [Kitasatospora sp. NPDC090091]
MRASDRSKVVTASGHLDAKGNPLVELAVDTGAPGRLWQLTKLGIVHLHG